MQCLSSQKRLEATAAAVPARKSKTVFFAIEGANALATTYFGSYFYFLLRDRFDFANVDNLSAAALGGFAYAVCSWQGGRFAQRFGYFTALKVGLGGMAVCLALGSCCSSLPAALLTLVGWDICMCFTWPSLEALVCEGVSDDVLPRNVGTYNVTWAATMAAMYFAGGTLYETLGSNSIFWLPAIIHGCLFLAVLYLSANPVAGPPSASTTARPHPPEPVALAQSVSPQAFLRMGWLAIPFSYVGITTIVAVIPGLTRTLGLSTAQAGLFCSIWMFARLATFIALWRWTGWHYRFRWLLGAFVVLTISFGLLLLLHDLWLLVAVQVAFGASIGLIYYSSLFYSMDVGETKGEHGGLHEAMIGLGICMGPALGAATLHLVPQQPNAGAYAVTALLACGLVGLVSLRIRGTR